MSLVDVQLACTRGSMHQGDPAADGYRTVIAGGVAEWV